MSPPPPPPPQQLPLAPPPPPMFDGSPAAAAAEALGGGNGTVSSPPPQPPAPPPPPGDYGQQCHDLLTRNCDLAEMTLMGIEDSISRWNSRIQHLQADALDPSTLVRRCDKLERILLESSSAAATAAATAAVMHDQEAVLRALHVMSSLAGLVTRVSTARLHASAIIASCAERPRASTSMLDITFADEVLDNMSLNLVGIEREVAAIKSGTRKASTATAAEAAAVRALITRISEKITSARRMLHLRKTAVSPGRHVYRARDAADEPLFEHMLPVDNVAANDAFTKVVDAALEAHTRIGYPAGSPQAADGVVIALMWTDPGELILRQLAHIDAVYGQSLTVTMLSETGEALQYLSAPPAHTANEALVMAGIPREHLAWFLEYLPDQYKKACKFPSLLLPFICDLFMRSAVRPGAPTFARNRCRQ